jgi:hypothetical protein
MGLLDKVKELQRRLELAEGLAQQLEGKISVAETDLADLANRLDGLKTKVRR